MTTVHLNDETVRTWRRIGHKLRGEGLAFQAANADRGFEALLVDTTDKGFLLFEPERHDDAVFVAPFGTVHGMTPLPPSRTDELRAAFTRSRAAA